MRTEREGDEKEKKSMKKTDGLATSMQSKPLAVLSHGAPIVDKWLLEAAVFLNRQAVNVRDTSFLD